MGGKGIGRGNFQDLLRTVIGQEHRWAVVYIMHVTNSTKNKVHY
jgi:hypothetical protein